MKKHQLANARKELLDLIYRDLLREQDHRNGNPEHEKVVSLMLSNDQLDTLAEGIGNALDGKANPFGIHRPRGNESLSAQGKIDAKTEASKLIDNGTSCTAAFKKVGDDFGRSWEAIRAIYYDPSVFNNNAELHPVWNKVLNNGTSNSDK